MTVPIPTLGYPTRWQAVAALRAEGLRPKEIAARLEIAVGKVYALIDYAKMKAQGTARPARAAELQGRTVVVSCDVLAALGAPAAARGISVNELARRILATVADDGLVEAVLDDGARGEEAGTADRERTAP